MSQPESWIGYEVTMNVNHVHNFLDTGATYQGTYRAMKCSVCGCTTLDDKYIPSLFAGGSGTTSDPFLIRNEQQFRNIGLAYRSVYDAVSGNENRIDYAFKLQNSITISGDWTPFPYKFTGDFNGNGYYVSYKMYLTKEDINASQDQGLFGSVSGSAKIHDLELMSCTIESASGLSSSNEDLCIGIVMGSSSGSIQLTNVTITNPVITCNISYASIGAIAGSFFSGNAKNCTVRKLNDGSSSITNNTRGYLGGMAGMGDIYRFEGCTVTITLTNTSFNGDYDMMGKVVGNSDADPADYNIKADVTIKKDDGCIAAGSLITLADGTQKPVEALTGDEMLLVWNLYTGTFDVAPIVFIDHEYAQKFETVSLTFSNGETIKVISEHGFWDYDLNQYVYLDANAGQYIGHWFCSQAMDEDGNMTTERVQLTNVAIQTELTTAWSPVTYGHLCYFVNGMLSMPGGIEGLFNIFEVDPDTMKYDADMMQKDIELYGLFSYDEFVEQVPVSKDVFDAFNGQYLKVAIGKGLIDIPTLEALASRYAGFLKEP